MAKDSYIIALYIINNYLNKKNKKNYVFELYFFQFKFLKN